MVKLLPISLSLAVLALLAACGSRQPTPVVIVQPAPVVTTAPAATTPVVVPAAALRPGFGRIESMAAVPTAASAMLSMKRLNIRMDDGSMQVVDTASAGLAIGDRVELTREGFIRRHPQG